jgi:NADH dehydrogenase [ubiquinone] 1 alpha subcomplex assembly factor 1
MVPVIIAGLFLLNMQTQIIFDFHPDARITSWQIVDDVVMGGRSSGRFALTADGHGEFSGRISLANNGGFSSVLYRFEAIALTPEASIKLRLKGDGKDYQFRVKHKRSDYYSYICTFATTGNWEEINLPLAEMYPSFRGRRLRQANFAHAGIEEVAILIANKRPEDFRLLIDKITIE